MGSQECRYCPQKDFRCGNHQGTQAGTGGIREKPLTSSNGRHWSGYQRRRCQNSENGATKTTSEEVFFGAFAPTVQEISMLLLPKQIQTCECSLLLLFVFARNVKACCTLGVHVTQNLLRVSEANVGVRGRKRRPGEGRQSCSQRPRRAPAGTPGGVSTAAESGFEGCFAKAGIACSASAQRSCQVGMYNKK
eukprot:822356-Rhodomonas_salina.2